MIWLSSIYLIIALVLYIALLKSVACDMEPNPEVKFAGAIIHLFLFVGSIFWPLLLVVLFINEKFLNKEDKAWNASKMIEKGQEEIESQWASPPYCSQIVSYQPSYGLSETIDAEFIFKADDVERYFSDIDLSSTQISRLNQEPVIHKWVKNRNLNDTKPTPVPDNLDRFQYVALDLIKNSKGYVACSACGLEYKCADLGVIGDDIKPSWNGLKVSCPNGHLLFYPKTTHILVRPSI